MLKRILSRVFSSAESTPSTEIPPKPVVENLEGRVLFHNPIFIGGSADNRGEVILQMDADSAEISPLQFNKGSVQMYSAGPDGILANADDTRVAASVRFTPSNQRSLVRGTVPAGVGYGVKVVSSRIAVSPGFALDGNFTGAFPSGDGVAGGNFEMQVKNIKTNTPTVPYFSTAEGNVDVNMFFGATADRVRHSQERPEFPQLCERRTLRQPVCPSRGQELRHPVRRVEHPA